LPWRGRERPPRGRYTGYWLPSYPLGPTAVIPARTAAPVAGSRDGDVSCSSKLPQWSKRICATSRPPPGASSAVLAVAPSTQAAGCWPRRAWKAWAFGALSRVHRHVPASPAVARSRPQQPSQKLTLSTQVKSLLPASSGSPSAVPPQVTVIERAPASNRLAVGYSDGSVRPSVLPLPTAAAHTDSTVHVIDTHMEPEQR
jgi:hypothetical protein